ncbi:MAG: hypothetical protein CSA22_03150 [Deltaproteobacteria bacterium]|nr:MAG: hypothetical protein CSA22_03150 [Deltaproteobacteria bacterium]
MFVQISTQLNCTESELWEKLSKQESLQFIASPVLAFVSMNRGTLDSKWAVGHKYLFKLYLLHFIPLGVHAIRLVKIDRNQNIISSHERGLLTPVWNHKITFKEIKPGLVSYRDEIEIGAGWLTPFVCVFAHVFYRHRQRRWKRLLSNERK